jgi:superfamily II DNA helicase RecQ
MNKKQILKAYSAVRKKYKFTYDLKPEQVDSIHHVVNQKHLLTKLPTGYGKTDTFVLPPLILNEAS